MLVLNGVVVFVFFLIEIFCIVCIMWRILGVVYIV